LATGS
jgi:hypothetical protein